MRPTHARVDASKQGKRAACICGSSLWRQDEIRKVALDAVYGGATCLAVLFFAQALWSQETKEKVTVDDVDRNFMVRLPKGYDAQQHYPVVILLHGMNQDRRTSNGSLGSTNWRIKTALLPLSLCLHAGGTWGSTARARADNHGPGRGGRAAAVVIQGAEGGIPEGVVDTSGRRTTATSGWSAERGETGGSGR